MNKSEIENAIIALLERNGEIPGDKLDNKLSYRYLDAGHIDSFSLISFIMEIEETFGITLSPEDTQSDEFRYISGLAALIGQKTSEKKSE